MPYGGSLSLLPRAANPNVVEIPNAPVELD